MDKHARELVIFERIVKEKKEQALIGMIIGIPVTLLFGGSIMYAFSEITESKLAIICGAPFCALIIFTIVLYYLQTDKQIQKMLSAVGVGSDEEMEDILENSKRLTNTVFMNDRYLMNFDTFMVTELCNIKSCKPYNASDEGSTTYGITVKVRNGPNDNITFPGQSARDEACKLLSTAIGFAEGQKYID